MSRVYTGHNALIAVGRGSVASGGIQPLPQFQATVGSSHSFDPQVGTLATDQRLLWFLTEMMMGDTERALIRAMKASPEDEAPRLIYSDYLEEQGRCESAKLVRAGWTPGGE